MVISHIMAIELQLEQQKRIPPMCYQTLYFNAGISILNYFLNVMQEIKFFFQRSSEQSKCFFINLSESHMKTTTLLDVREILQFETLYENCYNYAC